MTNLEQPNYQVQLELPAPAFTDTARAGELRSRLFAELDLVRTRSAEDVPWVREVVAGALDRRAIDDSRLEVAIREALAKDRDARQLVLSLGLSQDETDAACAGFVAIDLGFPPWTGARLVAARPMVDAVMDLLDAYEKARGRGEEEREDRTRSREALVSALRGVAAEGQAPHAFGEDDESSSWAWLASPLVLVAAIGVALIGVAIPMLGGVSDVSVMGVVVQSTEHRTAESLYYTTTVAYVPRRPGRTSQPRSYTITTDTVRHDVGSEVRVYYDPDDPGRASLNSASQARESRTALVALGAFAAIVWFAARRRVAS